MKKTSLLLSALAAAVLLCAASFLYCNIDSMLFSHLTRQYFIHMLKNDALTLHYTLADPSSYNIRPQKAALPVYSASSQNTSFSETQAFYNRLLSVRPEKLSEEERYTYTLLSSYLNTQLQGEAFPCFEEPLSPTSGTHTELPLLLAEYTFYDKEDVQIYLELLSSVPAYLNGLMDYEVQKADAGMFMPKEDALLAAKQCRTIMDLSALTAGKHFLQTTFSKRLSSLLSKQLISETEYTDFLAQNSHILTVLVEPAYQKLADHLIALTPSSTSKGGLCRFDSGKAYYAWLIGKTTGCPMEPDQLFLLLQKKFIQDYQALRTAVSQYDALCQSSPDLSILSTEFSLSDPALILSDLQKKMARDFPAISDLTQQKIHCTIKDVDEALAAFTSPAFYMTPPVDDLCHNTICINRTSTAEGVELYTTLAHEGYPGHLYQTVYSALACTAAKKYPVRELLYYGGYVEGWAYYAERLSYTYASQLLENHKQHENALLCEIAALSRDLQINLFCMLDISLHYRNASRDEIFQALSVLGIEGDFAQQVYDYLRTSPAVYLKYYVGYLEMLALKEKAIDLWQEDYSPMRFHTFLLEAGPSDFVSLYRRLVQTAPASAHSRAVYAASQQAVHAITIAKVQNMPKACTFTLPAYSPDTLCPITEFSISLQLPLQAL